MSNEESGLLLQTLGEIKADVKSGLANDASMRAALEDLQGGLAAEAEERKRLAQEVETADARARKALALHDEANRARAEHFAAIGGDTSAPGWWWLATPQALAMKFPGKAFTLGVAIVGAQAALALALFLAAGPGGGLRVLLQQAGLRTIYVPTPEPTMVP
jgi:hypothetical protein